MFKKRLIYLSVLLALGLSGYLVYYSQNVSAKPAASSTMVVTADIEHAGSEKDLIQRATLIIVGNPLDEAQEVTNAQTPLSGVSTYFQNVKVLNVLKGKTDNASVRILRAGLSSEALSNHAVNLDGLAGPLPSGTLVLFLQASAEPDVFAIVGHVSGQMRLNDNGHLEQVASEVRSLQGLRLPDLQQKINQFSVTTQSN